MSDDWARQEWRDLGFYYDREDKAKEWRIVGSREGLLRFRDLLREFVSDPDSDWDGQHDHYGPYGYLKILRWSDAGIEENCIFGTLDDLARLADLVENGIAAASPNSLIKIRDEYVPGTEYTLVLDMRADGFDPPSADPYVPQE